MNNKQMLQGVFFLQALLIGSIFSCVSISAMPTFDPMIDFRAPHSLTEVLQEGLISIEGLLQEGVDKGDEIGSTLSSVSSELFKLNNAYDGMIDRSKIHTVYRDDRAFLQKMIDRIDNMIRELEQSPRLSDQDEQLLNQNIELVQQLQAKI